MMTSLFYKKTFLPLWEYRLHVIIVCDTYLRIFKRGYFSVPSIRHISIHLKLCRMQVIIKPNCCSDSWIMKLMVSSLCCPCLTVSSCIKYISYAHVFYLFLIRVFSYVSFFCLLFFLFIIFTVFSSFFRSYKRSHTNDYNSQSSHFISGFSYFQSQSKSLLSSSHYASSSTLLFW